MTDQGGKRRSSSTPETGVARAKNAAAPTAAAPDASPRVVPPASAAPPASVPRRNQWARAAIDRVPARWLATGATGVFLAVTAAFGGLASVPEPPLPEIGPGETFTGAELEMTPMRVTVADELEYSGLIADAGVDERVLTLIMDVTNLSDVPRRAASDGSAVEVRIEGFPDVAPAIARLEDENFADAWLQPNVRTQIALSWLVSAADVADLTEVRVVLHTATEFVGSSVMHGRYWDAVTVAGFAELPVEEIPPAEEES